MRPLSRRRLLALATALPLLSTLVRGQSGARAAAGHGRLLIAHDHVLLARDLASGVEQTLLTLPATLFPRLPLWLPDGSGFYYAQQGANAGAGADYGTDIWRATVDGSNGMLVWQHDHRTADLAGLALTPNGASLLFGYSYVDISPSGVVSGQALRLDRLDLASGVLTPLREGAIDPAVARDGTIAYVDTTAEPAIWAQPDDGSAPRLLLSAGADFYGFFAPRFSPDGSLLLFAASPSGGQGAPAASLARYQTSARAADGPAQDIFTVSADGSGVVTRLTALHEDQPSAAWSADGTQVVVVGSEGVFLVTADGSGLLRLGDGYLHSQCAWLDR